MQKNYYNRQMLVVGTHTEKSAVLPVAWGILRSIQKLAGQENRLLDLAITALQPARKRVERAR
jgi:hypothetical protein